MRGASVQTIENLQRRNYYLCVSPYSFWETLCHLDEGDFGRSKGQLLKFDRVGILDDPRAEIEAPICNADPDLEDRSPDGHLIKAVLVSLRTSVSLRAFYSSNIQDSKGRMRQISGIADRVRAALDEEERRYIRMTNDIVQALASGTVAHETDRHRHRAILDLVEGYVIQLSQRGASEIGLRARLINDSYIHYAYIFIRALKLFQFRNTQLSRNDYEDGRICLHLKLNVPYCLVTADKRQKETIEEIIAIVRRLDDPQFQIIPTVTHLDSLRGA